MCLLSAHMAPRGRAGVTRFFCKHTNVLLKQGGIYWEPRETPVPPAPPAPPKLSSPIMEQSLAQRMSSKHDANRTFYLLALTFPSPNLQPSFPGSHGAICRGPMATARLFNEKEVGGGEVSHDVTKSCC